MVVVVLLVLGCLPTDDGSMMIAVDRDLEVTESTTGIIEVGRTAPRIVDDDFLPRQEPIYCLPTTSAVKWPYNDFG